MTALSIFSQYQIKSLPFNPLAVARQMNIRVVQYDSFCRCFDCTQDYLKENYKNDGFAIAVDGTYIIAYNQDVKSVERQRWTITHELCHILLGHIELGGNATEERTISALNERRADNLAAQLLCPLPVLHLCSVSTASEIQKLCGVSMQAAENRLQELTRLRKSGSIMASKEDMLVINHFASFISTTITNKINQKQINSRYRNIDINRTEGF